jgi:cation transport regulator ChaC
MPQHESWYFAYGSNLSKQQMLRRTGSIPVSSPACLPDYQLAFRKVLVGEEVYATIVPSQGAVVQGAAYLCSPYAMTQLDIFEGVGEKCYRRELVQATAQTGEVLNCIVYIGEKFNSEAAVPNALYLNAILTGAQEHQLPPDYIQQIKSISKGELR